jgi:hypothetical protein
VTPTERRVFLAAFALLAVASLVPIWAVRFQPLPDLPNHLAAVSVWHHIDDPRFDFARYYRILLVPEPYWVYYLSTHLLAFPLGLDAANRVVLSLYVVGLPLGAWLLGARFQRSPWLSLFVFPLAWNFNFAIGFITFCVGLVALPFALVLFDRFCERPTVARGVAAAAAGGGMYFTHLLPWGAYLGCAGMIGLLHEGRSLKRLAGRAAVWAVSLPIAAAVTLQGSHMSGGVGHQKMRLRFYSYWLSIKELPSYLLDVYAGHEDEWLFAGLCVLWLVLRLTARRRARAAGSSSPRLALHDLRALGCFLVPAIAYFVLPRSILAPAYWWGVNVRFAAPALLFGALCVPGEIAGWRRWLLAPVALIALAFAVDTAVHWRAVNRWLDGLDTLARIPRTTDRVLVIAYPPWREPSMQQNFAQSSNALRAAYYGGFDPDLFDIGFPLAFRERYPAPPWNQPEFRWAQHAPFYDYVLAFQAPGGMFRGHESEVTRVGAVGKWQLWRMPGPRREAPAPPYPRDWAFDRNWQP